MGAELAFADYAEGMLARTILSSLPSSSSMTLRASVRVGSLSLVVEFDVPRGGCGR